MIRARLYQPQGNGPFPVLMDFHGGAWSGGDRQQGQLRDNALAESGLLVVAVDLRTSPKHHYPAQVEDANLAIRWAKTHAHRYQGEANSLGAFGISSGGHTLMLTLMRPDDEQFSSLPLPASTSARACVRYAIVESGVLDPYVRYQYAKSVGRQDLINKSENYFGTETVMQEGNPQFILDRGEAIELPPVLLFQGTADANIPSSIPENFVKSYRAAGGDIEFKLFPGAAHGFSRLPGQHTEEALCLMKNFIFKQLANSHCEIPEAR
ncbi:MAG: alpha/beta hydrolase [Planctomycetaceae bacterium]|nr:alpha/beta hydrolase [Planctomycetaceae bacterium]